MTDETLFAAALEKPDLAARAAYLDSACSDPETRKRIDALLAAHDRAGEFLARPAVAPVEPEVSPTRAFHPDADADHTRTHGGTVDTDTDEALGFLAPPRRPESLGRIGHYEVLEVLGRGGFGIVFRAFDEVLQRIVALKVLAPSMAVTSPARKRFLREARSSASVRHENVVHVYAVEEQPLPYLVMEFIPGETLQQRLDRTGPLDVPEILRVGRQIATGLAAAHEMGLVHRDIKPSNILIDSGPKECVKITDFGLARAADDASISQSGVVAGTPMFMAPEQAKGDALDHRADLFSLGSVLYVICTGRPPFRASGALAVLKRVCEEDPRPIREVIPEVPEWLCNIIEKLHAKDPADRFQSAREVAEVLTDCEQQVQAHARLKDFSRIPAGKPAPTAAPVRTGPPTPWRERLIFALTGLTLAATLAIFVRRGPLPPLFDPPADPPGGGTANLQAPPNPDKDGWVQLFNGKDLTGWKTHPDQPGDWKVENGILIGRGPRSHLFSERGDYQDFHLRVEARINALGNSGVYFRTEYGLGWRGRNPKGYEAQIFHGDSEDPYKTGSLYGMAQASADVVKADEWFSLEVIATGNHIVIRVDGKDMVNLVDPESTYRKGHIALQVERPLNTVVQFRKIEIKELPSTKSDGDRLQGVWQAVAVERIGKAPTPDEVRSIRFEFTGNKITSTHLQKGAPQRSVFTLDPTKDPKQITVKLAPDSTFSVEGIYRFDGERLIVCMPMFDIPKARPTKFALDATDPARALMTFVRDNAASPAPPLAIAPFDSSKAKEHQEAWAKYLGVPVETTNSIGMKLRLIPPGEFTMGTSAAEIDNLLKGTELKSAPWWIHEQVKSEGRDRRITIHEPFYIGAHEVTVGQFREFVRATGYKTKAETNGGGYVWNAEGNKLVRDPSNVWANKKYSPSESHSAVFLTVADARAFCKWVGEKDGRRYAVPTEEQWEYACRAGTSARWFFGDDPTRMKDFGWTSAQSSGLNHPVGRLTPNPFGLYDIYGNATELAISSQNQVMDRGGDAGVSAWRARSAIRYLADPVDETNFRRGFRVVVLEPKPPATGIPSAPKAVLLKTFDPAKDKAVPLRGDTKKIVSVEDGAWRIENAFPESDSGNSRVALGTITDGIPENGELICRAKIKLKPAAENGGWGSLELNAASPSFHGYGYEWPRYLAEYRGEITGWTDKEVRYPVAVFRKKTPPTITIHVGLHGNGVLWVKDLQLLYLPNELSKDVGRRANAEARLAKEKPPPAPAPAPRPKP
jgi:uncharacterized protein (TIGR03067 family)